VIYLDTSVLLAQLLAEDRVPPPELWEDTLVASRLVEFELWVRLNARGLGRSHAEPAALLLGRIAMLELAAPVLARAREPFPTAVRTLDALHLASAHFLKEQGQTVQLASYDRRMQAAAEALQFELYPGL
jgi:predicted nucleic acid-binding protein